MTSDSLKLRLEEAEDLAHSLSEAISSGDTKETVRLSQRLSELSVPVSVSISSEAYPPNSIRLKVGVEDAQSDNYIPVTVVVSLDMTIAQLKDKISHDYGFHPLLQRWVIGKRLAQDKETLFSHGIREDGDQVFLFILSAQAARLTRHQHQQDEDHQRLESIIESVLLLSRGCQPTVEKIAPPPATPETPPPLPPKVPLATKPPLPPKPQPGWSCTTCTYLNKPTRPGCEMCGEERPVEYQVPDVYQPDQEETLRLQQEELAILQYQQVTPAATLE